MSSTHKKKIKTSLKLFTPSTNCSTEHPPAWTLFFCHLTNVKRKGFNTDWMITSNTHTHTQSQGENNHILDTSFLLWKDLKSLVWPRLKSYLINLNVFLWIWMNWKNGWLLFSACSATVRPKLWELGESWTWCALQLTKVEKVYFCSLLETTFFCGGFFWSWVVSWSGWACDVFGS